MYPYSMSVLWYVTFTKQMYLLLSFNDTLRNKQHRIDIHYQFFVNNIQACPMNKQVDYTSP